MKENVRLDELKINIQDKTSQKIYDDGYARHRQVFDEYFNSIDIEQKKKIENSP